MNLLPCKTCPWRVDQDASTIPNYNHKKACGLTNTTGKEDGFRKIMACHGSPEGRETACRGYLFREGDRNLTVRMAVARGIVEPPMLVIAACEKSGVELHETYEEVLEKLERTK